MQKVKADFLSELSKIFWLLLFLRLAVEFYEL